MLYPDLKFPKPPKYRPFFYTNFVSTVDGKVAVKKKGYWPIGSRLDYQVLTELRAYADCLIHGGNLAREFGRQTRASLKKVQFKNLRQKLGKDPILPYFIVSNDPSVGEKFETAVKTLKEKCYKHVLVEGGPTLLGSFLRSNLIDEIFLTISPKIFGSKKNLSLTLAEGYLFPPKATKILKLLSVKQLGNELYLRYQVR
ncbi:RibD family protein [Candidatus Daviesbacteria bacterium]|nr:RibD family protein [Candidatus Daviesbacteria bacterium]